MRSAYPTCSVLGSFFISVRSLEPTTSSEQPPRRSVSTLRANMTESCGPPCYNSLATDRMWLLTGFKQRLNSPVAWEGSASGVPSERLRRLSGPRKLMCPLNSSLVSR